jgi:20S proteasome alpha/beta subunit
MTVLIGLRCVDGAVLACDSQETRVNYFRFWPKANLIGDRFVTMYAGSPTLGEAFFRRLRARFQSVEKGGLNSVKACQLIEEVLLSLAQEAGKEAVEGRQILIAGVSDDGEVCLWAVDSGEIYVREMRTWECYGSGIDAAEMLMKDLYFPDITVKQAARLLAYVVHAVSEICIDCGGPINVVVVDKSGVKSLTKERVESELDKVRPILDRLRKELPKRVLKGEKIEV